MTTNLTDDQITALAKFADSLIAHEQCRGLIGYLGAAERAQRAATPITERDASTAMAVAERAILELGVVLPLTTEELMEFRAAAGKAAIREKAARTTLARNFTQMSRDQHDAVLTQSANTDIALEAEIVNRRARLGVPL